MNITLQASLVEACRAQLQKISGAGFSAHWQEGLSRNMSFTWLDRICVCIFIRNLSEFWELLVHRLTSLMDSTPSRTAFDGTKANVWVLSSEVSEDLFPLSRLLPLVIPVRAKGTMNKDPRFAKKGQPPGFGHGRRHSCLGYVTDPEVKEKCSKCWMCPDLLWMIELFIFM